MYTIFNHLHNHNTHCVYSGAASFRTHRPDRNPVLSSAVVNPVQDMGELPIVVDPVDNPDGVTLNVCIVDTTTYMYVLYEDHVQGLQWSLF